MRTVVRRIAAGAAVGFVLVGVAGCDGGGGVVAESKPPSAAASPSPSPSASAVVIAPERPTAMDDDGLEGAKAAAVHFLELDSYVQATGDTAEWSAMSHESCSYCATRIKQAEQIAATGAVFTGGEATVRVLKSYQQDAATGIWPLDVEIRENATKVVDSSGKSIFANDANTSTARVEVGRRNGAWVIVTVADVPD